MKKTKWIFASLGICFLAFSAFVSCKDPDTCPSGGWHIYTSAGEYSSESACSSAAYSRGYKYYCYDGDGKCHAYYTK